MALTQAAESLLADLNPAQREAVLATSGPLAILAGAGTGKTRVISRRAAYAIATGTTPADQVLMVTFSDKAAGEMGERLRALGHPAVTARTFHAHALSQLRWFWPSRHDGEDMPRILESKIPIVGRLARSLPGGYRFAPAKDLADEIEWAKSRRLAPNGYLDGADALARTPPIPAELFVRLYADYERAKKRAGQIDFDDMLTMTVQLLEEDVEARTLVHARKSWLSVDEYQDTNPLQERLLELWVGGRRDLCVVGDEDQTIYTFAGATSAFLSGFAATHEGARMIRLTENYRSSPQVLELANRLIAATGRVKALTATRGPGPEPSVRRFPDDDREAAAMVAEARRLIKLGTPATEIAVLVRTNAQLVPIEQAFTRSGLPYQVRGQRFYERRDVREAVRVVRQAKFASRGREFVHDVLEIWSDELGFQEGVPPVGGEARERSAAMATLLAILEELVAHHADTSSDAFLAEITSRDQAERHGSATGVNLLTYHRAKGLEWDAVFLPMLEEGSLPIHHAAEDSQAVAEERRLLYVGMTRARTHLALSWADFRTGNTGREGRRRPSRFLDDLVAPRGSGAVRSPDAGRRPETPVAGGPLLDGLRAWRLLRAKTDAVPAYVVAHDATLQAIAESRPGSIPELRRIKGMGPLKLDKYGEEILTLTRNARSS